MLHSNHVCFAPLSVTTSSAPFPTLPYSPRLSLLYESVTEATHPNLIEAWKSAVDSWVDTILLLLSSNTSVERWAGISLIGITCEECSSVRFLGSSPVWFKELLKFLQPESQADSHLQRVAACASISDLFARLSGFPKSKKEWSSDAVKVVEPVLSMLRADNSEPIWEAAVHVSCTMITSFQSSINRHFASHYESVESAIAVKLLSGGCSLDTLKEILILINDGLRLAFQGLEEETVRNEFDRLLVLPGKRYVLREACNKATTSELLPHAASIVRIITKYFKTCVLPELRTKVYSVAKTLLISMGVGMALCLAQEVINNAIADLSTTENKNGETLNGSNSDVTTAALQPENHRNRKHSSTTGSLQEYDKGGGLGLEVPKNRPLTPISLRIAALEALEPLITVAGALRSEQWRSKVDSLLIVIAMDSFKGSSSEEINVFQQKEPAATATDLQLAAMRALLASFLSFARFPPPYLAQGLELFRRGKQQIGTKVAELCAHALLTLEVLIHPRALPLVDYVCANNSTFGEAQCHFRDDYVSRNSGLPRAVPPPDYDDDFDVRWFGNGHEVVGSSAKKVKYTKVPLSNTNINIQERSEMVRETATCAGVEMRIVEDEINFKSDEPGESVVQFQEPISCIPVTDTGGEIELERIVSDNTVPHMESGQESIIVRCNNSSLQRTSNSNMVQEFAFKLNCGLSVVDEDAFPDIVDVDPDSDFDSE